MANITKDDLWKVFSLMMSALVLPLSGWVWNTNIKVAELQNDLGDAESEIAELQSQITNSDQNAKQIIGMEKDIEYMKNSLGRIEGLVTRKVEK
jgi:cell division protein FtsL